MYPIYSRNQQCALPNLPAIIAEIEFLWIAKALLNRDDSAFPAAEDLD
jgi:hypothetical protein